MTRTRITTLAILAITALLTTGCTKDLENQVKVLKKQNNELRSTNIGLKNQLKMSDARAKKYQEESRRGGSALNSLNATRAELAQTKAELRKAQNALRTSPTASAGGWKSTTVGDEISVGTDVLFSAGRAKLTNQGKRTLSRIAADIRSKYGSLPIRVYGYTDGDPIRKSKRLWKDNLDLSANRAMAVSRYLRSQSIDASRIETVAMGETHPTASNKSKANKKKNRRVEIMVVRK